MSDESPLSAALRRRKLKYFPDFFAISKGLISAYMATLEGGDSGSFDDEPDRRKILMPLEESNIVGSEVYEKVYWGPGGPRVGELHKPVLDIDLPIWAKESTTPGHWHLIIDKEMPWSDYKKLLEVMADVGILEEGFVKAAISRRGSWIRVPWVKKQREMEQDERSDDKF